MNPILRHRLIDLAKQLDDLAHGKRGSVVSDVANELGWSVNRVYTHLRKLGWCSGRKKRADAGTTALDEDILVQVSALARESTRANGKTLMQIPTARSVLAANGRPVEVSNGRLASLMRQRGLHTSAMKRDRPASAMRSLHPNHVHQVDPSYCVLYYLPGSKGPTIQRWASEDEFYKNKPQNFEKQAKFRVWRYVLTDHFSSTIIVRYYQSAGESSKNLFDFLLYCWQRMEGRPFHGVPKMLVWDKGSANTSGTIKQALGALDVEMYDHAKGNARAKGQVEKANDLVERFFESRLKFEPVNSVEELNDAAESWSLAYNANSIPAYDSRLQRPGMTTPVARFALWQTIRQEHLRQLPSIDLCQALLHSAPETRKVSQAMTISFSHPMAKRSLTYDVRDLTDAYPGSTVNVSWMVYGDHQVKIFNENYKGEVQSLIASPVQFDDFSGFRVDAPVWGEEFDSKPDTIVELHKKAADRAAYPDAETQDDIDQAKKKGATPFAGIDAHSHLKDVYVPDYMNRRGTEISLPDTNTLPMRPMSHVEACKELVRVLSRPLTPEENQQIRSQFPGGVPEAEFDALAARLRQAGEDTRNQSLKVVK